MPLGPAPRGSQPIFSTFSPGGGVPRFLPDLLATITPLATTRTNSFRFLTGFVLPVGIILRTRIQLATGSLTPAATLFKRVGKIVAGIIAPTGKGYVTGWYVRAVVTPVGVIVRRAHPRCHGPCWLDPDHSCQHQGCCWWNDACRNHGSWTTEGRAGGHDTCRRYPPHWTQAGCRLADARWNHHSSGQ